MGVEIGWTNLTKKLHIIRIAYFDLVFVKYNNDVNFPDDRMYHLDFNMNIIKMRLLKIFIILNQQ